MVTETISNEVVVTPTRIMQTGFAFWSSKVLLSAVNLQLFTLLAQGSKTAEAIKSELKLQERGLTDFLDALVAMNFLHREGNGASAKYCNTLESDAFLDKNKSCYLGGMLEMANNRLYPFWNNLEEALQTGQPQNEVKNGNKPIFETLYEDENKLKEFVAAMGGIQTPNFIAFARQFNFADYDTHCDIGGAGADLSIQIAKHHPSMHSISWDLPQVAPIATRNIEQHEVQDRIAVQSGSFFTDEFPKADVITMGNILHDWNLEQKKMLIQKAYNALPKGGAFVVIENVIDDERKENAFGLLMSLNMLIETRGGFDYTAADFISWTKEAGFAHVDIMHLAGPASALIAYK
ncbi:methyltransferase [Niastella yeongjuensis]|uniref:Methyltransferase n=1 Tax=Niastella yeongjuensis TaxID=354355 RepID=A0A1V9EMX3_9BACT|nr:methyltransferase [Niastella yeongjuensis]OQP47498.1 methyltransferase [Niastella yeongjuensis]SEN86845.1 Precorrin-6B methylase 2 [Niastella yeongjuensis]